MMRPKSSPRSLPVAISFWVAACGGSTANEATATPPVPIQTAPTRTTRTESPTSRQPGDAALTAESKRTPDVPPTGSSLDRAMRAHFHDALLIHDAVIAGKPDRAVGPARALAIIDDLDSLPSAWRPFVARMQQDARRIDDTASPAQTSAATADLMVTCGRCHQKLGGPMVPEEPPPLEGASVDLQMKRHKWASQKLWEGLVVPSDEAWEIGVKALAKAEFAEEVLSLGGAEARGSARDLARLLAKANPAMPLEERSALYAQLLVTCGTCHRAIKIARNE